MKRSNCLVFALWLKWHRGGRLWKRKVRPPLAIGYHYGWTDGKRILHYEPIHRMDKWYTAIFHKFWFKGRIRRYDTKWPDK